MGPVSFQVSSRRKLVCEHLYHCVISLVVFALAFVQAITGPTTGDGGRLPIHIWMGRAIIIISMINGGLGLLMASDATRSQQIAYDVVAAVVWAAMITVIVRVEKTKDLRSVTSWSATWLVSKQELLDRPLYLLEFRG